MLCAPAVPAPATQTYIKRQGVRGIPHVLVFDAQGNRLIGMGASFKVTRGQHIGAEGNRA